MKFQGEWPEATLIATCKESLLLLTWHSRLCRSLEEGRAMEDMGFDLGCGQDDLFGGLLDEPLDSGQDEGFLACIGSTTGPKSATSELSAPTCVPGHNRAASSASDSCAQEDGHVSLGARLFDCQKAAPNGLTVYAERSYWVRDSCRSRAFLCEAHRNPAVLPASLLGSFEPMPPYASHSLLSTFPPAGAHPFGSPQSCT